MGTFIIILIALIIGAYGGFHIGKHFIQKENNTIKNQNELLQQYSTQWANASISSYQLSAEINDNQTRNTTQTLSAVIQLLGRIQQQETNNMDTEEKAKIQQLINQARSIQNHT